MVGTNKSIGGVLSLPLFLLLLMMMESCVTVYTARGAYHKIREGETLITIAQRYRSTVQDIAEINNIDDEAEAKAGRSLYIPGVKVSGGFFPLLTEEKGRKKKKKRERVAKREKKKEERKVEEEVKPPEETIEPSDKIVFDRSRFAWPLVGDLSSLFGIRHGRRHDGIDIRAPKGTSIRAATSGEVVFSNRMKGYGNLILLKHADNFFTIYAHNSANLIKKGKKVKKGEVIARVGQTGKATGPHLHFEVRDGRKARNPLFFLPKNQYALRAKVYRNNRGMGGE